MTKQKYVRLSRADGLRIGQSFAEEPKLKAIELPVQWTRDPLKDQIKKEYDQTARDLFKSNIYIQRFFTKALPNDIFFGLIVWYCAVYQMPFLGFAAVFIWAVVDVLFGGLDLKRELQDVR